MEELADTAGTSRDVGQEVPDSSDSDVDSLQIAIETTPKRRKRQFSNVARLPKVQASASSSSQLNKTIEETIQKCENITPGELILPKYKFPDYLRVSFFFIRCS